MGETLIHNMIWFILLFPMLGVLINGFFGRKLGKRVVGIVGPACCCGREGASIRFGKSKDRGAK